jgi:hypothetical protein
VGVGVIELVNEDGALDGLLKMGMDGRAVNVWLGLASGTYPGDFAKVFRGTVEQPTCEDTTVVIRLRDRQQEFAAKPMQATKYAGNNSLPNGVEGTAADLRGRPKPRTYGKVLNVAYPCVNTTRLIYQVNSGAVTAIPAVYDQGVALTPGTAHASQAALEGATVTAGTFDTWLAGGMFRLGATPAGLVTADVTEGANVADRTAAQIGNRIVGTSGPGGLSGAEISSADLTTLDTAFPYEIGIAVTDEMKVSAALDLVAASAGAWWGFDSLGVFRIQQLLAPSGSPVADIPQVRISRLRRVAVDMEGRGLPCYRVKLRYARLGTTQTTDLAGAVTDARRARLAQEYLESVSTDAAIQTKHLLAPELQFDTLIVNQSDADAESARLLTLLKAEREVFDVLVEATEDEMSAVDMGSVIKLTADRYGMDAGKDFRVIGIQPDFRQQTLDLTVWG